MNRDDRDLGMDQSISRREFLNGVGVVAASALAPGCASPPEPFHHMGSRSPDVYPPARSGPRGNHPGSFETAHELAFQGRRDWGAIAATDAEFYDLVIVGGGLSGLSAAHFQLARTPGAKILILDNHDDFGGHAKRNEFQLGDRTVIGYGGSQTLENPSAYSGVTKGLLRDIGVDVSRFKKAYDHDFYRRYGLGAGVYFDRATYGVDRVVPIDLNDFASYIPIAPSRLSPAEAVAQMPLSEPAKRQLLHVLETTENQLTDVPPEDQEEFLWRISYREFLTRYLGVSEPEVFALLEGVAADLGARLDSAPAIDILGYVGLPGYGATALDPDLYEYEPYITHFPDGNVSIARMLVREMIPAVAPGSTMEDIVTAPFDYARLDEPGSNVRLRLDSTVVDVAHDGPPQDASSVEITYVKQGRAHRVRSAACVLAGYNAMIPHLCPQLPKEQRDALSLSVKSPILYSTVLLRNWKAWEKLGIGVVAAPGSFHTNAMLDYPVSLGGYEFSRGPDQPIAVHMERFAKAPDPGMPTREQLKAVRRQLLATSFEEIEREIRSQLTGTLAAGGFDPTRDIEAITVNRWAHGYSYSYSGLFDPDYAPGEAPHEIGRQRFGRIAIANSDAGASPSLDSAIDEAYRAINELNP